MPERTSSAAITETIISLKDALRQISESILKLNELPVIAPVARGALAKLTLGLENVTAAIVELEDEVSSKNSATDKPGGPKQTVFIIDDEEAITAFATDVLERAGYEVIGCTNGFAAIDLYKRLHPSVALVILDYTLPIMNGAEVFAELRAINPKAAVMLSSGYTEQKEVKDMLSKGLCGFLPKPYTEEKMLAHVKASIMASPQKL